MVVLTPRFALLAALSSIAAVSALPAPLDSAAIQIYYRDSESASSASHHATHSHTFTRTASADAPSSTPSGSVDDDKPQRQPKPVIPLPSRRTEVGAAKETGSQSSAGHDAKEHDDKKEIKHDKGKVSSVVPIKMLFAV